MSNIKLVVHHREKKHYAEVLELIWDDDEAKVEGFILEHPDGNRQITMQANEFDLMMVIPSNKILIEMLEKYEDAGCEVE